MAALITGAVSHAAEPVRAKAKPASAKATAKAASAASAAAAASASAASSASATATVVSPAEAKRRAAVEFWTTKYDGADLRPASNGCPAPRLPSVSKQSDEIDRVTKSYNTWKACHDAYVGGLKAIAPLTKQIPAEVKSQMSEAELAQSTSHLAEIHAQLLGDADIDAGMVQADFAAWRSATSKYIVDYKAVMKAAEAEEKSSLHTIPLPP